MLKYLIKFEKHYFRPVKLEKKTFVLSCIYGQLRNLVLFVKIKKRETPATLLKVTLLYGFFFSRFLNCTK